MSTLDTTALVNGRSASGGPLSVVVADGLIQSTHADASPTVAARTVDLGGRLVVPAMAEPHAHLDKALTAEAVPNPTGDLMGAITAWTAASAEGRITPESITARAVDAMGRLVANGVTAVRTHVNVGAGMGASQVTAVRAAADEMADLIDVQLVALVASPLTGPDGAENRAALDAAIEAGVDLVGGCPHLDPDGAGLIDHALTVAVDAGLPVDLHMDEMLDPDVLFLDTLARAVLERGFQHGVTASHCVTLGMQPAAVQHEVAGRVAEAGVAVVTLPQTNLFLQGRDHPTATPRGLTALDALADAGALVAGGADNVQDPFNLVGRSDPLETAALLVMAGHRLPERAFEMVSGDARQVLGLTPVALTPGDPADLVAIGAPSVRAAMADAPADRMVFRAGRLVASTRTEQTLHRSRTA
ncbi:MAG: amidohydrolase family protein [Actinomycetota bacterium]